MPRDQEGLVHRVDLSTGKRTARCASRGSAPILANMKEEHVMDRLNGLRIAITGGTSGLGLALVREWHRSGARVAFVARTPGRVEQVARDLAGVHGIVGDVS